MTKLQLYNEKSDLQLQFGQLNLPIAGEDVVIGMSLGALVVLRESAHISSKIILINPPLPKRSISRWFLGLLHLIAAENPFNNRQKFTRNPARWVIEIIKCIRLLSSDFDPVINRIPKNRLIVIRGRKDTSFADEAAVEYLRLKGVKVIEIESGHNWSEVLERSLQEQSSSIVP